MEIKKLLPPDFRLIPWRQFNNTDFVAYDYKNGKSQIIGYYNFYVNDKTGEFGYELRTLKSNLICVWWQKKLICQNLEKILDHIAYHSDGWKVYRSKNSIVTGELRKDSSGKYVAARISFEIITNISHSFLIPIKI